MNCPPKGNEYRVINAHTAMGQVKATRIPSWNVDVAPISFWLNGIEFVEFGGGLSQALTAPVTGAKWSALCLQILNGDCVITVVDGEAKTNNPPFPKISKNQLPLVGIYINADDTFITNDMIFDIRGIFGCGVYPTMHEELTNRDFADCHPINAVSGLRSELNNRPTFVEAEDLLKQKADIDGTPSPFFVFNKDETGVPTTDVGFTVARGNLPSVGFRWNEQKDRWEFTNDGIQWFEISNSGFHGNASVAEKGLSKLSVEPVDHANPIAVGDNDPRLFTEVEKVNTLGHLIDLNDPHKVKASLVASDLPAHTHADATQGGTLGLGVVVGDNLADQTIPTTKIMNSAITGEKIADGTVTESKILDGNITANKIADNSVSQSKIIDGAIVTSKIADFSVTDSKLADNAITGSKILQNSITADKIADNSIVGIKLIDNIITNQKIVDGAVTNAKIADSSIDSAKLLDNAVTSDKIVNGAITGGKIADGTIAAEKLTSDVQAKLNNAITETHNSHQIGTKVLDDSTIGDDLAIVYDVASDKLVFRNVSGCKCKAGPAIDDTGDSALTVFSSQHVVDLLDLKANQATTYTKLEVDAKIHAPEQLGTKSLDEATIGDNKIIAYSESQNKLVYVDPPAGTGSANSGIMQYEAIGSTGGMCTVRATGAGVSVAKVNTGGAVRAVFTIPNGVKLISAMLHFNAAEVGTIARFQIDIDDKASDTDYSLLFPPTYQVYNDVEGSRAMRTSICNWNINAHVMEVSGLLNNVGVFIKLQF